MSSKASSMGDDKCEADLAERVDAGDSGGDAPTMPARALGPAPCKKSMLSLDVDLEVLVLADCSICWSACA
eukprot:3342931-Amphidinium_carterae.1